MVMILTILVFVTLVSVYMPRMILWYFDPPTTNGISCAESIRWSLQKLQNAQLISIGVGAVIGFLFGLKFRVKKQG